ncbi:MAG: alpha/beta hydrolase [Chloroflexota bacterium]
MTQIHYETFGSGEKPVLMVHGWASSHTMWAEVHPLFTNATVYAPDLPGFGKTPPFPTGTATIDEYVEVLIDFCDSIVTPQMIVAHSTGGIIVLKALTKRPDLAEQLLLIAPVVSGKFGIAGLPSDFLRTGIGPDAFRSTEPLWKVVQGMLRNTVPFMHPNRELAQQMKDNFLSTLPQAGIEILISMAKEDLLPQLADIQQPTLIIVGKNDPAVPPQEGATAARRLPNSQFKAIANAAHHPMNEQTEVFASVANPFLDKYGLK